MTSTAGDPFAQSDRTPSVSFKDKPIGTSYTLEVLEAPAMVQARDYESGEPAFWPDGGKKMTVVTKVVDKATGETLSLWAPKPSALFAAISEAQKAAGAVIAPGGTLVVTFTGEKPNEKNPRLNPAKQYAVRYTPGDAFGAPQQPPALPAQTALPGAPLPPLPQTAYAPSAQPLPPAAPAAAAGPSPEAIAALRAAGVDPATVYPGFQG